VDGAPEVCEHGKTGLLVPPGNLNELRAAVEWMADHPDERITLAREGRSRCIERFSTQRMVESLEHEYQNTLSRINTPK